MNWKRKAQLQKALSLLPRPVGDFFYYILQRYMTDLKKVNPVPMFKIALEFYDRILKTNHTILEKKILELGTGRRIHIPLVFWLLGAKEVVTTDLFPYLKAELVYEDLCYLANNQAEIRDLFRDRELNEERFQLLLKFATPAFSLKNFLSACNIKYIYHCDARNLSLYDNNYFDYHVSCSVLEHIPEINIKQIFNEANRVMHEQGLFIHRVDYSDHFSHSDSSISPINFLQFTDETWNKIAGNKFMYMNRLRVDDIEKIYSEVNHKIINIENTIDPDIEISLKDKNFKLDSQFKSKPASVLAVRNSWIISNFLPNPLDGVQAPD